MSIKPVVALIGRPNVGKSTLFNQFTKSRQALVADLSGLTRDRQYGDAEYEGKSFIVVDTGGIGEADDGRGDIDDYMSEQSYTAIHEADIIVFVVDARAGMIGADAEIGKFLHTLGKPVYVVANKVDGVHDAAPAEFYALGLGEPYPMAASHGRGVGNLLEILTADMPEQDNLYEPDGLKLAIIGRPNVGKSTLVNRLLGEDRVVVFDMPGTTRDSIYIPFERNGKKFTLIDTAGMRRRSRVSETIEKFSVIKSLQAIEQANVVIYLIDAREGIADQDAHLLGLVLEAGRALIIGLNKWDGLNIEQKETIKRQLDLKLPFLDFAEKHPISALHGSGVGKLFDVVHKLYDSAMIDMSTPVLTRILKEATGAHQPPIINTRRIKLKYAHQGGRNPPIVVIHGVQTDALPLSYKRYLMNYFRDKLKLSGTPIRMEFKSPVNPFHGQKKKVTEWQVKKRERLLKRAKSKK